MTTSDNPPASYEPDAVAARYRAERDRRLVDGRASIRDLDDPAAARFREDPFTPRAEREQMSDDVDAVVIGGGMAGVLAGSNLRKAGLDRIRVMDQAGGFGGTWYWNRYPGVMCDVESYIYMPMLEELDYVPTERYASGDEIRRHLVAIAERFDLDSDALFHTGAESTTWDPDRRRWRIVSDRGDDFTARYLVLAVGILNRMKIPRIEGMDDFAGHAFHTGRWDYAYTGGAPGEPMTELGDKVVGLVGTGATGIQCVPGLAAAAQHLYVFQRTPSAIGVRGNRKTEPSFADELEAGWQQARMDNFQAIMLGRPVDADLADDGWTHHYAAVNNPRREKGMSVPDYIRSAETLDFAIMEEHRQRVDEIVDDPAVAEVLKPHYRYVCKRPCFHDEYLPALNADNVTVVDCPSGWDRITQAGPVVNGESFEVDCLVYATGFEAELTPLHRRAGHEIVGVDRETLEDKFADGASTLFGMLVSGFPNMFVMPAPGQQAVVTVNYTHLAVLGAEFIGGAVAALEHSGAACFDVTPEAEADWTEQVVASFVDTSAVMSACTPSRINNEGDPQGLNPRNGNWGRGFGDYFAYRDLLHEWLERGDFAGLDVVVEPGDQNG